MGGGAEPRVVPAVSAGGKLEGMNTHLVGAQVRISYYDAGKLEQVAATVVDWSDDGHMGVETPTGHRVFNTRSVGFLSYEVIRDADVSPADEDIEHLVHDFKQAS